MEIFYAERFVALTKSIAYARAYLMHGGLEAVKQNIIDEGLDANLAMEQSSLEDLFQKIKERCDAIKLDSAADQAARLLDLLSEKNYSNEELVSGLEDLENRLFDAMKRMRFFHLFPNEIDHYDNYRVGWETIIDRFPQAIRDIEEARKCFAVSRYPASIFHSLHIVEAGLIDLGGFLQVHDPKSGWTAITNEMKRIIEKKHPARTDFEKKNFPFIEQVYGTTEALKNAWRNKISHAEGKLYLVGADFAPEIAEEILLATRSFMRRLADGLPASPPAPTLAS